MRTFRCRVCRNVLLFDNFHCTRCGHRVAWCFERRDMLTVDEGEGGRWRVLGREGEAGGGAVKLCANYHGDKPVCNVAYPADDPDALCLACRLTRTLPNLANPAHEEQWGRMERGKRRTLYTLLALGLDWRTRTEDPANGLAFDFLSPHDAPPDHPVVTGHADGLITISVDEAVDEERTRLRNQLAEPYRTVLGHFRHEVGHYYWDRLIRDGGRQDAFRAVFGDERDDYAAALARHYHAGPPPDWPQRFISAYASAHPWEDWAETWAHYLHMVDVLEIAQDAGLDLDPRDDEMPQLDLDDQRRPEDASFDELAGHWHALTFTLNNLNRGMGLDDAYPFAPSATALAKLRFVHRELAHRAGTGRGR